MDRLWSPWRSELLQQPEPPTDTGTSLFSRLVSEGRDEENLILWRGSLVFVIMNKYPYNNGHLLIAPFRQVTTYEELTREEQIEIATTLERCMRWLRVTLKPHGFNTGMNVGKAAGAGLPDHLHVHVVPRWNGDTNFMSTTADMKVIPEGMRETYRNLRATIVAEHEAE